MQFSEAAPKLRMNFQLKSVTLISFLKTSSETYILKISNEYLVRI